MKNLTNSEKTHISGSPIHVSVSGYFYLNLLTGLAQLMGQILSFIHIRKTVAWLGLVREIQGIKPCDKKTHR